MDTESIVSIFHQVIVSIQSLQKKLYPLLLSLLKVNGGSVNKKRTTIHVESFIRISFL